MLLRPGLSLLLCVAAALLTGSEAQAEDLSLKVENYIFAASEALDDGEPALALSLLRRAKSEAPDSCIVEEYLCRCYIALGNLDMARGAQGRFVACMAVSDEGVLAELDGLIAQAEDQAPAADEPALVLQEAPPSSPATSAPVVTLAPPAEGGGGGLGWILMGSGAALGVGGGVASWLTWSQGQQHVEQRERDAYLSLATYNHAAVIGGGVGGALAVTGLVMGLSARGRSGQAVQAAPWLDPSRGLGLTAQVEF